MQNFGQLWLIPILKSTRRTGILICVTQMTHFFTKLYKISLKKTHFDKNNFINVNLMQQKEITYIFNIFSEILFLKVQAVTKMCVLYAHLPVLLGFDCTINGIYLFTWRLHHWPTEHHIILELLISWYFCISWNFCISVLLYFLEFLYFCSSWNFYISVLYIAFSPSFSLEL